MVSVLLPEGLGQRGGGRVAPGAVTYAAIEQLRMELVKAGTDGQEMHEIIPNHRVAAREKTQQGAPNPLVDRLVGDQTILGFFPRERVLALVEAAAYIGDAPQRARAMASQIRAAVS